MKQKKLPSLLGGSMIIAGTAIGAGMLANPTAMSGIWFLGSVILFLIIMGHHHPIGINAFRGQSSL